MSINEVLNRISDADKKVFCVGEKDGFVCMQVDRQSLWPDCGKVPRRIDFKSQDEFHTAHYEWQRKTRDKATSMLMGMSDIYGFSGEIRLNAWDQPVFYMKTT